MTCHLRNMSEILGGTDFGAGDFVVISDAKNHSDFGVLPEHMLENTKKSQINTRTILKYIPRLVMLKFFISNTNPLTLCTICEKQHTCVPQSASIPMCHNLRPYLCAKICKVLSHTSFTHFHFRWFCHTTFFFVTCIHCHLLSCHIRYFFCCYVIQYADFCMKSYTVHFFACVTKIRTVTRRRFLWSLVKVENWKKSLKNSNTNKDTEWEWTPLYALCLFSRVRSQIVFWPMCGKIAVIVPFQKQISWNFKK